MKAKLLVLTLLISSATIFSQDIGFLGDFEGWSQDIDMVTADNTIYTKTNYYLPNTGLKFRENNDWVTSWGGDTFPSGSATGNNISVLAGFYDITFDRVAGTYNFASVAGTDQNVSVLGEFNGWVDVILTTSDNLIYTATNLTITAGNVKFRRDGNWILNFGGTDLIGTATPGGADLIIPFDGDYDLSFNIETLEYSIVSSVLATENFQELSINIFNYQGKINIKGLKTNEDYSLSIFDITGREVKQINSNAEVVDISELNTALYFLTLETSEGNMIRKKFFKN
jgi:hypothetical protein